MRALLGIRADHLRVSILISCGTMNRTSRTQFGIFLTLTFPLLVCVFLMQHAEVGDSFR